MEQTIFSGDLTLSIDAGQLVLCGELDRANGAALLQWLQDAPPLGVLALGELEIADGVACTHALNAVRLMRDRVERLQLEQAPQALAHNLYRTGMLLDGTIELVAMREDEAYG
ncbi:MAG: hypothetical protein OQK94_03220 [Gammaproteobacteria bacterium]|nr:hypothetical protein [Gammaproteobacteria bacterium]MCW8959357.1 hypothetical protein [Gammaproteobacteria bacterium]MCW8973527.1 hypothetical protein [Gammaproteobacteria bacterium]MCW8992663.1 hypothetical protein [Gammaproteobacteria bacterium]